jgi:DNA repair exonuclease SbcCD ATPase subunit
MFLKKVHSKYKITSSGAQMLEKMIEDAREELDEVEVELKQAREKYSKLVENDDDDDDATLEELEKLEDEIEKIEEEHEKATDAYDKAMSTTIEDLKADQAYDDWKSNR